MIWLTALIFLGAYEVVALFMGYEYTLTAGARDVFEHAPWTMGLVAAFFAWLIVHLMIEKKKNE